MIENAKNRKRQSSNASLGILVGLLLGYPLSYFFQPALVRGFVGMGEYMNNIGEIFNDKDLRPAVLIGITVSVVIFTFLGIISDRLRRPALSDTQE